MAEVIKPKLRALKACAQVASLMVILEGTNTVAQPPIVTLGLPSAKTEPRPSPWEQAVVSDVGTTQAKEPTQVNAAVPGVLPNIQINAFALSHADEAQLDILELFNGFHASPNHSRQSLDAAVTVNGPDRGVAIAGPKNIMQEVPASQPQWSDTPAEPRLSPAKWIHQPLIARRLDRPERLAQQQEEPVVASRPHSTVQANPQNTQSSIHESVTVNDLDQASVANIGGRPSTEIRPLTEIRRAALRQRAARTQETYGSYALSEPVQTGYSIEALRKSASDLITEAQLKLEIRAYLTAEEKAKKALELITQSIDARQQSALASRDLMIALTAIREAEDFVGKYGMVDGDAIARMVRSHSTEVLKPYNTSNLNGVAAADIYLDWARRCITPIAAADPLAAEAIRVLSQSHRLRDNGTPFGIATSVHLIRAAVAGAPNNEQIRVDFEKTMQIAGLAGESLNLFPKNEAHGAGMRTDGAQFAAGQNRNPDTMVVTVGAFDGRQKQDVRIIEVTPEEFAAISPAMAGPAGSPNAQTTQANRDSKLHHGAASGEAADQSGKSRLSRVLEPITRVWR